MSDVALAQQHQPQTYQAAAIPGRSAAGRVTGKLKDALDSVVNDGVDPYEAAQAAGLTAQSMRRALKRRHVLAYLKEAREVLRITASAQNIHHAIKMRNGSSNQMAKLGAMKFIEGQDEQHQRGSSIMSSPGMVIQIVQQVASVTPHLPRDEAKVLTIQDNPDHEQG